MIPQRPNPKFRGGPAALAGIALAVISCLAGCRARETLVAVIPRTCGTWLWEAEHTGVAREAPSRRINVYWNGPMREDDVQAQIEILSNAVQRNVAAVIIAPIQDLPLRTPLQHAIHAGIPVVVVATDVGLPEDRKLAYVLNDEHAGGQLAARRIGRMLHGAGTIAILGIDKRLESMAERARSLESTLADEFPGIHVMFRSLAVPTVSQEQQVAEQMLANGHPDAIVTLSGQSTRGALFALIEFNLNGKLPLVGFDQNLLAPIRTGELDSVIIQNTYRMGRVAMQTVFEQIAGNPIQSKIMVEPELVTRETIDSPGVRETLDLSWWLP